MHNEPSRADAAPPAVDEVSARTLAGLRNLVAKVTPWLIDVGSWIFGGLTAVNLVVVSALITVGPVDAAIRTSTAALAAALPLNVAGIVLLRLIKDVKEVGIDGLALRAFQTAGFPHIDAYFPPARDTASQHARRSRVALLYSAGIAALSTALTLAGMTAALWHMGRSIAFVLVSAVAASAALVTIAIAHACGIGRGEGFEGGLSGSPSRRRQSPASVTRHQPMDDYVLDFEEIDQTKVAVVGGKGAHLAELSRIEGVRVPAGFCVTTSAFQRIVAEAPSLDKPLERMPGLKPQDRENDPLPQRHERSVRPFRSNLN